MNTPFDCTRCGACCTNPDANRDEGYREYVQVVPRDAIVRHPKLMERYVLTNDRGEMHMKLDAGHRCAALRGSLARRVRCEVYTLRPAACRRVTEGSDACLRARRERGIGLARTSLTANARS